MSLLSAVVLPMLEKELLKMEPDIAEFVLNQVHSVAGTVIDWVKTKGRDAALTEPPQVH